MIKTLCLAVALFCLAGIAGCGEDSTSSAGNAAAGNLSLPGQTASSGARTANGGPIAPVDAQYTIRCHTYAMPNHALLARRLKDVLAAQLPGNFYVIQGESSSTLYYGFYASDDHNTADGRRAQEDIVRLKSIKDDAGQPILDQLVLVVPIETPDTADANPQWNLNSYPRTPDHRYYFSVEIAAFKANAKRKEAAVQMVKDLRAHNVEAYYYHGQAVSSVTIGMWPITALKKQDSDVGQAVDSTEIKLYANMLPPNVKSMTDSEGNRVTPMVNKIEIEDPSLIAMMQKFNSHSVNYEIARHAIPQPDGTTKLVEDPSFIVVLPHEAEENLDTPTMSPASGDGLYGSGGAMAPRAPDSPPQPSIPTVPTEGSGKLKSLGE